MSMPRNERPHAGKIRQAVQRENVERRKPCDRQKVFYRTLSVTTICWQWSGCGLPILDAHINGRYAVVGIKAGSVSYADALADH